MKLAMNHPLAMFLVTAAALWLAARTGVAVRKRRGEMEGEDREDFGVILTATLTLLGLLIGFSFSMATSRYDQRKNYEEAEANAIGTEYVRADLLRNQLDGKQFGNVGEIQPRSELHDHRPERTDQNGLLHGEDFASIGFAESFIRVPGRPRAPDAQPQWKKRTSEPA